MDVFDKASELEELHRAAAILNQQARQNQAAVSAYFCEECGEPISEARRLIVVGCRCCVDCQEEMEKYAKTRFAS